ncbi:unnamed protein product [Schistosoma margrebowiei]|uniref:Uncharacterized protein n=1 Tax=Schistosoma margrebowiei TaxID=48269 RepID=A0A183MM31_9TREM|nr:unnamed protein product [Schistosoma margrebowiei]
MIETPIEAYFSNDLLFFNDILNKFDENALEKSDPDVISNFICSHNAFVSCGELVQCEAQVSNEIDFDSDDFISTVVYPYHEVTSNEFSNQFEKNVLN